jgi:hypothetical protein
MKFIKLKNKKHALIANMPDELNKIIDDFIEYVN